MRKRLAKKELKKTFQAMLDTVPCSTTYEKPKKSSTADDLAIIVRVIQNEFDDAPAYVGMAKEILPYYAWWFLLEAYCQQENLCFKRTQTSEQVHYTIEEGFLAVAKDSTFSSTLSAKHVRPIELILAQKGYTKKDQ